MPRTVDPTKVDAFLAKLAEGHSPSAAAALAGIGRGAALSFVRGHPGSSIRAVITNRRRAAHLRQELAGPTAPHRAPTSPTAVAGSRGSEGGEGSLSPSDPPAPSPLTHHERTA